MKKLLPLLLALYVTGCASNIVVPDGSVNLARETNEIISIHSRIYPSPDHKALARASMESIKTLGYTTTSADLNSGVIVAKKEDSVFNMGELIGKAVIAGLFGGTPQVSDKIVNTASISVTRTANNPNSSRVFVQVKSTTLDTTGKIMRSKVQGKDSAVYEELFFMISERIGIDTKGPRS